MSTPADWKRIEELAEKATPLPWSTCPFRTHNGATYVDRRDVDYLSAACDAAPDMASRLRAALEYAGQLRERSKSLMQQVNVMGLKHSHAFEVRAQCLDDVARELLALLTGEGK
jgi:hypothetical protein